MRRLLFLKFSDAYFYNEPHLGGFRIFVIQEYFFIVSQKFGFVKEFYKKVQNDGSYFFRNKDSIPVIRSLRFVRKQPNGQALSSYCEA